MKDTLVENRLKYLYALQHVDSQLQEIQELKGDLPTIVAELEAKVGEIKAKIKELNDTIKKSKVDRGANDSEIIELQEKVEKYKGQQLQVKSNKQYDALTREIDAAEARASKLAKEMESLEGKMQVAKADVETLSAQLAEASSELSDRQKDLKEVNKEHEKEEGKLRHEREKLVVRLDQPDLERYERIRKAKGGLAVVPIKRSACGGCFNRVPPQKILELRQNSGLYQCEHCGRIVVSTQIVELSMAV